MKREIRAEGPQFRQVVRQLLSPSILPAASAMPPYPLICKDRAMPGVSLA
jgi:hypothetical protein